MSNTDDYLQTASNSVVSKKVSLALKTYGIENILDEIPINDYKQLNKKNFDDSVKILRYQLQIAPYLKKIEKHPGVRIGKGIASKKEIVEELYGLNSYECRSIEQLEPIYVEKAIEEAKIKKLLPTFSSALYIKRREEINQRKEQEKKELENKIRTSKHFEDGSLFSVGLIDITMTKNFKNIGNLNLPFNEDATLFIHTFPDKLIDAIEILNLLGFRYLENIVWDRILTLPSYKLASVQHSNIIVGVKGSTTAETTPFKFASVYREYVKKVENGAGLPDYYYSNIEQIFDGENILEVYSHRFYSDRWCVYMDRTDYN